MDNLTNDSVRSFVTNKKKKKKKADHKLMKLWTNK